MTSPELFIKDQFPVTQWPVIPTVLKSAYAAANDLYKDNPFLEVNSAQDNRGRLIAFAVDFGIERAIKSGAIDCDYRWEQFARPTGRYLQLRFKHSTASVSQIADPLRQPRPVVFRENARLRTQQVFAFEEFREELEIVGLPHFLLVHGHQSLEFAHIGLPSAASKTHFSWTSPNLMKMPHAVSMDAEVPPEDTDTGLDDLNLLKEDIERWIKDNGE
ncbi:hypothetical protein IMCC20628_04808 (plasmid) [Hoeflea sp. IMCC20628]|uniref:hypothetical protein n=1 Tax=Hoeflea sp. IMCC20628 TaxID=1620421 RepID=UPI00063B035C|nr:hypothetical protein [Hoeflea sp. IMCC20628]AKI03474.1 hypothetical protein IMCC20628_04808 [Hoeflea sp. IMCC20628]